MHVVLIKYIQCHVYICMHACRNFVDILKVYRDDVGDVNDVAKPLAQECDGGICLY